MSGIGYVDSVILGVVEGITEFLPVSSTGHLTVVEGLLGIPVDDPSVTAYTAIIQFGAIVATFLYFREDIVDLVRSWWRGVRHPEHRQDPDHRFSWAVIAGSLPIGVVGLVFKDVIAGPLRNLWVVAAGLILWSIAIYLAERNPRQKYGERDLSIAQVLLIGLGQCLALAPGVSRSGATIAVGLFMGATRVAATRLSFFLAIPALTGAGLYELKDVDFSVVGPGELLVGTLISFVVAYASIAWLLKLVARYPLTVFVPYRVVAGLAVMAMLATGVLSAT